MIGHLHLGGGGGYLLVAVYRDGIFTFLICIFA